METARQWLTTLSLAGIAVAGLTLAFTPNPATATTPEGFTECFFLNGGAFAGRMPNLVMPISQIQAGKSPTATFGTVGFQPVTSIGEEILMCR